MPRILASAIVCILLAPLAASAITIDTVLVGDVGNANDPSTGFGRVDYAYQIGTTEVTVGQYAAFLNAVAADDPKGLYIPSMGDRLAVAGIVRSGSQGSFSYTVINSPNHPMAYMDWARAARFSNWMHNGQPVGAVGPGTTETGAYTLTGANTIADLNRVTRNSGARWFIPSENEWYKAAYFQPAARGGDVDGYWLYPMRTNATPYSDQPPGNTPNNTRVGNFFANDGLANGFNDGFAVTGSTVTSEAQNYLTDVGAYKSSPGPYGTFDQGGNLGEWTEKLLSNNRRQVRGGAWVYEAVSLLANNGNTGWDPYAGDFHTGFRIAAAVPEPSTVTLAALGALGLLIAARRRQGP